MTTVVLGAHGGVGSALAARLDARGDTDERTDVAVVVWSLPRTSVHEVDVLEQALLGGMSRMSSLLRSVGPDRLRRVVNVVAADAEDGLTSCFRAAVGGLTKSWARELAATGTTVNAVGHAATTEDPVGVLADVVRYLTDDLAGYVTGQTLGAVGERLARPTPMSPAAVPAGAVLVSGGSGAIGEAIVRRLHDDGHHILIGYVRASAAERLRADLDPTGRSCAVLPLDMTDQRMITEAAERVAAGPPLAGVVICGGWNRTARFVRTEPDEWQRTVAINLTGPARLLAALAPSLPSGGRLVGIGSESGRVGDAGRAVYAGAKAGLSRLLSDLQHTRPTLSCVTISPGPVDTPLMRATHGDPVRAEQGIERLRQLVPLRRLGLPEEVAHSVGFAFSAAGRCLAGEVVSVGGGVTMS